MLILVDQSDYKMNVIVRSCMILLETSVGEEEGRLPACSNTTHLDLTERLIVPSGLCIRERVPAQYLLAEEPGEDQGQDTRLDRPDRRNHLVGNAPRNQPNSDI